MNFSRYLNNTHSVFSNAAKAITVVWFLSETQSQWIITTAGLQTERARMLRCLTQIKVPGSSTLRRESESKINHTGLMLINKRHHLKCCFKFMFHLYIMLVPFRTFSGKAIWFRLCRFRGD